MSADQLKKLIINQLDLEGLPSDVQGAILVRLTELALKQMMLDAYDALSTEHQKTLKQYFAKGDPHEVRSWLAKTLPNLGIIADEACKKIVDRYQHARLEIAAA